jgi:hypothetical protein
MDERTEMLTRFASAVVQRVDDTWHRHCDEHGCLPLDCPIARPLFNAQYALPERFRPVLLG